MVDALLVTVDSQLDPSILQRGALPWSDLINGRDVRVFHPVRKLLRHVEIFLSQFSKGADRDAGWIIESRPAMVASRNQVSQEKARNGAMSHSMARVSGGNVDILFAQWMPSNES